MIYRVVTYDRATERIKGSMPIPVGVLEQVKHVAGFGRQDDGLGEYPLDEVQTRQVARILNFNPEPGRFYYYVQPYESPEDDAEKIPLKILICDAERGAAATLEQAIRRTDAILGTTSVHTLDDAKTVLRGDGFNTIFVDPLSFDLDEASSFIFSVRESFPEIVFVLYIDKEIAERRRVNFYREERKRFSHYYELDKHTPISLFDDEIKAVLTVCRSDLIQRMSAASGYHLTEES
jgi:hypothetical protein